MAVAVFATGMLFGRDPHGKKDQCQSCHLDPPSDEMKPPDPAAPSVAQSTEAQYPLRYERERIVCERCHSAPKKQSHPVEIVPMRPTPTGWPLDAKGRIMCSTCHESHAANDKAGARRHLLRGKAEGARFCQECHQGASPGKIREWHMHVTQSAHDKVKASKPSSGKLDHLSTRCLECHDGTLASNVGAHTGKRGLSIGKASSHPVGVRYPMVPGNIISGKRSSNLRGFSSVDKRIRLFDGKVGCGSCHNPYSKNEKFLVIDPKGGRLCRSCHDM